MLNLIDMVCYIPLLIRESDEKALGHALHNCECPIPEDIISGLVYNSNPIIEMSSSESSSETSSESSSETSSNSEETEEA